jgi:transposase
MAARLSRNCSSVLAEVGDDRTRFADARALKAYAGSAPVTRPSGRFVSITHRHIKNNRLATADWIWAFAATANCEPAHGHLFDEAKAFMRAMNAAA